MQRATLTVAQLRSTGREAGREAAILRSGQKDALGTTLRIPAETIVPSLSTFSPAFLLANC